METKLTTEQFKKKFTNVKMVVTPELSKAVQEKLFKTGQFGWNKDRSGKVRFENQPYLYIREDGTLLYGQTYEAFRSEFLDFSDVSAMDILNTKVVDREDLKIEVNLLNREVVNLGEEYRKINSIIKRVLEQNGVVNNYEISIRANKSMEK